MPLPPTGPWDIQITEGDSLGRSFVFEAGALSLGASPDCEIVSNAAGVAPRHAEFLGNAGALQLRILEGTPPVLLNGNPVRGLVEVPCPAIIQVGVLRVTINRSLSTAGSGRTSDSTLRFVHPASPRLRHFAEPDGLDVTGRIVYHLPEAGGAMAGQLLAGPPDWLSQKTDTSFSDESTMAFSMDSLELEIANKMPVRIDYEVKGEIARGGMGKIYSAEDSELDRLVALKVSTAAERGRDSQFFREAKVLAALAHPNIVPIHTVGVDAEGRPFYSMKLIQGRTLQWILKQLAAGDHSIVSVYTRERLLDIFRKVCDAVSFAHSKGYLHRDLKPENIMVGEFGEVLVMDWGLAKEIRKRVPGAGHAAESDVEPEMLSYIEGTPQYMSPEQANGIYGGLDECSDIYSLGGVLYSILTYRPPVSGASLAEVLEKVRSGETTTMTMPRRSGAGEVPTRMEQAVPEALRAVTLKALSRDKTKRYQTVSALVTDIEAYQSGFATSAEDASLFRQVWLLVKRHRMASSLLLLLACGSVLFTVRLAASEKTARDSEKKARLNAERADSKALEASEQRLRAEENERFAVAEKQAVRLALAQTQLTIAEAAEQRFSAEEMDTALRKIDPEFRLQEWNYLNNLLDSSQRTVEAMAGCSWKDCVPHPAKPGVMITLQNDNWLRTLDLNTGASENLFKMDGSIEEASLAVSPDASLVAVLEIVGSKPGVKNDSHQVAVWTLSTGKKKTLEMTPRSGRGLLDFSPDGQKIMRVYERGSSPDSGLTMFDVQTGKMLWQRETQERYDAEFVPKSDLVRYATTSESLELNALDGLPTKRPRLVLRGQYPVMIRAQLLFKTPGPNLRHYDEAEVRFEQKLAGKLSGRKNLAVHTKDKYVVALCETGDNSAVLQVRELEYGGMVQNIPIMLDSQKRAEWRLAAHEDSGHYAVFRGKTMKVWNIRRYNERVTVHNNWCNPIPQGFAFLSAPDEILQFSLQEKTSQDPLPLRLGVCRIKESGVEVQRNLGDAMLPKGFGPGFCASRDGRTIAALTLVAGTSRLTTYRMQPDGTLIHRPPDRPFNVGQMKISPEGDKIMTYAGVIDTLSGGMLQKHQRSGVGQLTYEAPSQWCWTDSRHIVEIVLVSDPSASEVNTDRSLVLWTTQHPNPLTPPVPAPSATALSASPDGTLFAEGGKDGKVRLRDAKTLLPAKTLRVHDGPVSDVAWHPTLPLLATASEDNRVRIWNVDTGKLVEEFGLFYRPPERIDWSPDGRNLAVLSHFTRCFLKPTSCQGQ